MDFLVWTTAFRLSRTSRPRLRPFALSCPPAFSLFLLTLPCDRAGAALRFGPPEAPPAAVRPWTVRASLETVFQRDSNVLRRPGPEGDAIGVFRPSVEATGQDSNSNFVSVSHGWDVERFANEHALDARDRRWDARGLWRAGPVVADGEVQREVARDRARTLFSDQVRREEVFGAAAVGFGRAESGWAADVGLERAERRYRSPGLLNSSSVSVLPRVYFGGDVRRVLETRWEDIRYPGDARRRATVREARIGRSTAGDRRVAARVSAGFQRRQYADPASRRFAGPVADAWTRAEPGRRTGFEASYAASVHEASLEPSGGYFRRHTASLAMDRRVTERLSWRLSETAAFDRYGNGSSYPGFRDRRRDRSWSLQGETTYRLWKGTRLTAGILHHQRTSNVTFQRYHGYVLSIGCQVQI
jgi:hypothetical protein